MNYVFEETGTFHEWLTICVRWRKPARRPAQDISSLSRDELLNKVVCVYKLNADRSERDIGLVKAVGASTPIANEYVWVRGINSIC